MVQKIVEPVPPRTTTDIVFDKLYKEILTLDLLPGSRISEAEVASRLGVSRQPVRDAFNRLGNLDLVQIRPQRATEVCRFSMPAIENARFVRLAVELEVVERACAIWDTNREKVLEGNLCLQQDAIDALQIKRFHELDYEFHRLICELSGMPLAFETIEPGKRRFDRLCLLSLGRVEEVTAVLDDHRAIARTLAEGSVHRARQTIRRHLRRLDATIREIHKTHSEYFE